MTYLLFVLSDTLTSTSKTLATEVPAFMSECRRLLAMPAPVTSLTAAATEATAADQPWGDSREAYLAWRVEHSKREHENPSDKNSDHDITRLTKTLAAQGKAQDTAVGLLQSTGAT